MPVRRSVDNLLVAGRCASMTHEGQAAGMAAAKLGATGFVDIDAAALQGKRMTDGVDLDH